MRRMAGRTHAQDVDEVADALAGRRPTERAPIQAT